MKEAVSTSIDEENVSKVRFTVALPIELVIKMDSNRSKIGVTRIEWIKRAILEKLNVFDREALSSEKIEEILDEVKDIKKIILKRP